MGQDHGIMRTFSIVLGAAVGDEMGSFVDKRPSLGVGTVDGEPPEEIADVDGPKLIGN